jgi:hypothetical protein
VKIWKNWDFTPITPHFQSFLINFQKCEKYPFFKTPSTQKYVKPHFLIGKFNYLKKPDFPKIDEKTVF